MTLFASRKTGQLKATTSKTEKLLASIFDDYEANKNRQAEAECG